MSVFNSPAPTTTKCTVQFAGNEIEITVTIDASTADDWVESLRSSSQQDKRVVVGLACESTINKIKTWSLNKVVTLQLCVENKCLILQLFHMDRIPVSVRNLLSDTKFTFVGAEIKHHLKRISGCEEYNMVNLDALCGFYFGLDSTYLMFTQSHRLGLEEYAKEILGLEMEQPKHVSEGDWQARVLTQEQIRYACVDAYVSYRLGFKLEHLLGCKLLS